MRFLQHKIKYDLNVSPLCSYPDVYHQKSSVMYKYHIYICIQNKTMSIQTSVSIKEEHRIEYLSMRTWLKLRNQSIGDYLIQNWRDEFRDETLTTNK